jgi:hypothetical protein
MTAVVIIVTVSVTVRVVIVAGRPMFTVTAAPIILITLLRLVSQAQGG